LRFFDGPEPNFRSSSTNSFLCFAPPLTGFIYLFCQFTKLRPLLATFVDCFDEGCEWLRCPLSEPLHALSPSPSSLLRVACRGAAGTG
jgi:hypothetical protein